MTITYLFSFGRLYGGWISSAAVIFLIAMFTFLSEPLHGQITRYVSVTGDDLGGGNACADSENPCRSVSQALSAAASGDHILISQGIFTESLTINKSISIRGAGQGLTIIQAHTNPDMSTSRVFTIIDIPEVNISDVTIRHGMGSGFGGAILNNNSSLTLTDVTIGNSKATYGGGGMAVALSSPTLNNVTFSENSVTGGSHGAGGMLNTQSSPVLTDVVFVGNAAGLRGGAMVNLESDPVLKNVAFKGNVSASGPGGAVYNEKSSPSLTNVIFSGNHGVAGGGMYNIDESTPMLTNVTFSGNSADGDGGGMYSFNSNPTIRNSIFWNNRDASGTGTAGASVANLSSTLNIYYSMVQGCYPDGNWSWECGDENEGNLPDAEPLFNDTPDPGDAPTTAGDLGLQIGSPVIDQGDPDTDLSIFTGGPANPIDLAGNPRVFGRRIDMGAYEYTDPTSVGDRADLPATMELHQNYPNPFNPATVIGYQLMVNGYVTLRVYDIFGREVATLVDKEQSAGVYEVEFNVGANLRFAPASGIYFYRLRASTYTATKKMLLTR
jgi:predicted outer membrane repeat protein